MFGYLEGIVFDVGTEHLILKVNGIGYEITSTQQTISDAHVLIGQKLSLWIYSHVREDAFTLFGFLTKPEKEFFMQLLKVNGVGPKMAMTIMSGGPLSQIQLWIEAGDAKALSSLPKVGKKTAEQIILTLQGKLVIIDQKGKVKSRHEVKSETHRQIASALVNLGFKPQLVDEYISSVAMSISIEDGVRQGLQKLTGNTL